MTDFTQLTTASWNYTNVTTNVNGTTAPVYNSLSNAPLFISLYALVFIFSFGGNSLVIWIVMTNRKMHEITINYLLVNLAIADLVQTLASIFHVIDFVVKDLNIGDVGCKFQINMFNIPYGASGLTMVFIAYERYCAICKPVHFQNVKNRIRWLLPSIWLASVCLYAPTIAYCGLRMNVEKNQLTCDCTERWPSLRAKNTYGIFLVVVLYLIPLLVISRLYFVVIRRLKQSIPGERQGTVTINESRRGVVKMLFVTVVVFFVSWTPYNVLYFLKRVQYDYRGIYRYVWYPALLLSFISCALNPIIYCFLSKNFRNAFKAILCCVKLPNLLRISTSSTRTTRGPRANVTVFYANPKLEPNCSSES